MAEVLQWECDPHEKLEISPEILKSLRYKVSYRLVDKPWFCWCRNYQTQGDALIMFDVVTDTSDRIQGILMKKRLTYRTEVHLVNVPVVLFPVANDDIELEEV